MADIAVIGAGRIGGALAKKWAAAGHAVVIGARDPDKPEVRELVSSCGGRSTSIADAVAGAGTVVFAIPGAGMAESISALGSGLDGKLVVDAANNVRAEVANSRAAIMAAAPRARYVRAFNSLGWEMFDRPVVAGVQADLFFCCAPEDREEVEGLISDVGLRPVWVGGPDEVEVVDAALRLWFALVVRQGRSRRLAFKVIAED